jgi:hypothetical protein
MFTFAIGSERFDGWLKKESPSDSVAVRGLKALVRISVLASFPLLWLVGMRRVRGLGYYDYRLYHGNLPHRLYTTAYLVALLKENGLRVDSIRGVGFSFPFIPELEVLLRRLGIVAVAQILARIQAGLDEYLTRTPDHSQNILIVATISGQ